MVYELDDAAAHGDTKKTMELARNASFPAKSNALFYALYYGHFDLGEQLIEQHQDIVSDSWLPGHHWTCAHDKRRTAHFLMKHEFKTQRRYLDLALGTYILDYIHRNWSPGNHLSWPRSLRKRIVTFLCAMARVGKGRQDLTLYVIRYVVTAHFH